MENLKPNELINIISKNPDSKESKEALARLNFYYLKQTNRQNKIITWATIFICISTIIQAISLLSNCT